MSYRVSIEFPSQRDFRPVQLLLDRLGVSYHREGSAEGTGSSWLDELGLVKEPEPMSYEAHLTNRLEPVEFETKPITKPPYGAWEKEEESLEDLLGMLTS
ncbi:MAG: hypothetical protein NWR72_18015 [Bacteroidia bacterium]|nr:hypothetical protein [Bacteroidia bacterium]